MRRTLLAIVALAALAVAIGACGGGGDDGGSDDQKGEITITCASCQTSPSDPGLQFANETTKLFNKKFAGKYRVKIIKTQYASSSPDRLQYFQRLALANDLPDIFVMNPGELRSLYKTGKLMDFKPSLDKDPAWKDAFYPGAFDAINADGKTYAIPQTRDAIGIYYNKAMFKAAGISQFPSTWDEFEADCQKIVATGKKCFAMDGDWVTLLMWANLIGTQPGGKAFLDGGIRDGDYSTVPQVVQATDRLKSWHTRGFINRDAFSGEYQNAATAFISGQAAMIANGPRRPRRSSPARCPVGSRSTSTGWRAPSCAGPSVRRSPRPWTSSSSWSSTRADELVRHAGPGRSPPTTIGPLLLPEALGGGGHPVVIAVAAASAAAAAGLAVEPVGTAAGELYLAHRTLDQPLVIDPWAPRRLVDARALGVDLYWRCPHEAALCLLEHMSARAIGEGDLATSLAASALRFALPLEDDAREAIAADHAGLVARLN